MNTQRIKPINIFSILLLASMGWYAVASGSIKFDLAPVKAIPVPENIGTVGGPYAYVTAQDPISGCSIAQVPKPDVMRSKVDVISKHLDTNQLLYISGSGHFDYFVPGDKDGCPSWREMIREGFGD